MVNFNIVYVGVGTLIAALFGIASLGLLAILKSWGIRAEAHHEAMQGKASEEARQACPPSPQANLTLPLDALEPLQPGAGAQEGVPRV